MEAWHRAVQQAVDCNQPSICKLINHFRLEQDRVEIELERHLSCVNQPEAILVDARLWRLPPVIGCSTTSRMSALFYRRTFVVPSFARMPSEINKFGFMFYTSVLVSIYINSDIY